CSLSELIVVDVLYYVLVTLGNGIATSYSYDVKGRMIRLNSSGDVHGNTKVLQDAVYSFNPNNNITNISNTTTDFNTQYDYGYDGLGRLTSANGSYLGITEGNLSRRFQQSFGYAKNGNLTSKRIHDPANGSVQDEWSYQYTNHQVTNIDSSKSGADTLTMSYDANGNLTRQRDNVKDLTKRISVDSQDRITQIQDGNNAILGSYWYDDGGFRIRRSALEEKNNVFTNVEILYPSKFYGLEFIESENVITSVNNVYLNGVRIAAMNEAGALAYYLTDQVDSVSHVLDDEGNTLSQIQYQPYGETFVQRGDLNFSPKYNSQELDRESGFYFYNARYYDPGIARFTSADTIIDGEFDTQGWNRFSYVKGNPIGAKDPTGHDAVVETLAGVNHVLNKLGDSSYKAGTASKDGSFVGNSVGLLHDSAGLAYKTAASLVPKNRKELEEAAVTGYGSQLARATAKGVAKVGIEGAEKVIKNGKAIVIGEGMTAVKTAAKNLQSQGVDAKWYQAWGKNFPKGREMTPKEMGAALGRNEKWLNSKMKEGYNIYDIGNDPKKLKPSPFYGREKSIIQEKGYSTTELPRPK
ncbi:RHS repeat-associated core domain-containing protein, partial [Leptospira santarosai]|uniref:RHS repeat domain-containing protein n=1 Tax=Leptospira santarosai TaxID=28183 RepID=UPI0024AEB832